MADRSAGTLPPATWRGMLEGISRRFRELERRVTRVEERAGQTLPPDYRFETDEDGALVIRRVSTGATTIIDV